MDNSEKLIRALIDKLGYKVVEIFDRTETPVAYQHAFHDKDNLVIDISGQYKRGPDDCYYIKSSQDVKYQLIEKTEEAINHKWVNVND